MHLVLRIDSVIVEGSDMSVGVFVGFVLILVNITACVGDFTQIQHVKAAAECEKLQGCSVSGLLEISNDGHAYIGILRLDDGSCINVSLPERQSKQLAAQAPQAAEVTGRVLFFPYEEGVQSFTVNGRKVGYGKCSRYFLFAK